MLAARRSRRPFRRRGSPRIERARSIQKSISASVCQNSPNPTDRVEPRVVFHVLGVRLAHLVGNDRWPRGGARHGCRGQPGFCCELMGMGLTMLLRHQQRESSRGTGSRGDDGPPHRVRGDDGARYRLRMRGRDCLFHRDEAFQLPEPIEDDVEPSRRRSLVGEDDNETLAVRCHVVVPQRPRAISGLLEE